MYDNRGITRKRTVREQTWISRFEYSFTPRMDFGEPTGKVIKMEPDSFADSRC
jgi:hypothetical protein